MSQPSVAFEPLHFGRRKSPVHGLCPGPGQGKEERAQVKGSESFKILLAVPNCSKFVDWGSANPSVSASFSVTFSLRKISSESSCGVKMAKGMEIERMNTDDTNFR